MSQTACGLRLSPNFEEIAKNRLLEVLEKGSLETFDSYYSWSMANIYIEGLPLNLDKYPCLIPIYLDKSTDIVLQKSAQCGATEMAISKGIYFSDQKRENTFYGMPTDEGIGQLVQSRVNPRIEDSPYLRDRVINTNNIGLKQIGQNFMHFKGSKNRRQIITAAAGFLIMDEVDEMVQMHIPVMLKRLGNSAYKWTLALSTPSIPGYGINKMYLETDQMAWHNKCKYCGKWQTIDFFKNIKPTPQRATKLTPDEIEKLDVKCVCKHCAKPLDNIGPGKWIALNPGAKKRGYQLSKLNTGQETLKTLWITFNETDNVQEFFNSDLGLPYVPEGGQLGDNDIESCYESESLEDTIKRLNEDSDLKLKIKLDHCTMGVDVGSNLNYRISKIIEGHNRMVEIGIVKNFEDLDVKMEKYDISMCIIDALPETRKAEEFRARFPGRVLLAWYNLEDDKLVFKREKGDRKNIRINRTRAMDNTAEGFLTRHNVITRAAKHVDGYFDQLKAPVRVKKHDPKTGNEYYVYIEGSNADHYYHAEVYDDIASKLPKTFEVIIV